MPTVWFSTDVFSLNNVVSWTEDYQAYTSQSQVMPRAQVMMNASFAIDRGMQLNITDPSGLGQVQQGGPPNAISILNRTFAQFTCGLALGTSVGGPAPIHALPLFGNMMGVITPVPKVFLMLSTRPANPGTVMARSTGSGVLVDLTGSPSQTVSFDINSGVDGRPGVAGAPAQPGPRSHPAAAVVRTSCSAEAPRATSWFPERVFLNPARLVPRCHPEGAPAPDSNAHRCLGATEGSCVRTGRPIRCTRAASSLRGQDPSVAPITPAHGKASAAAPSG